MTYEIASKFKALALALAVNGLMLGAVNYLFDGKLHDSEHGTMLVATHADSSTAAGLQG